MSSWSEFSDHSKNDLRYYDLIHMPFLHCQAISSFPDFPNFTPNFHYFPCKYTDIIDLLVAIKAVAHMIFYYLVESLLYAPFHIPQNIVFFAIHINSNLHEPLRRELKIWIG